MKATGCKRIAGFIAEAAEKGLMLPKTPDEVEELMEACKGFMLYRDGQAVSFAAVYEDEQIEIGSVVTDPAYRHQHLASETVWEATQQSWNPEKKTVAFTNEASTQLFHKIGFRELPKAQMPQSAQELCKACGEFGSFPNCHCHYMCFDGQTSRFNQKATAPYSIIRNPDQGDILATAQLFCTVFGEEPWNESFEVEEAVSILNTILEHDNGVLLIATRHGKVLGASGGFLIDHDEFEVESSGTDLGHRIDWSRPVFYVDELFVDPSERGQGIGSHLTHMLCAEGMHKGPEEPALSVQLLLRTDAEANPAIHVYQNKGFVNTNVRDNKHASRTYFKRG